MNLRVSLASEQNPPGYRFSKRLCPIKTKIHMLLLRSEADMLTQQGVNGSPRYVRLTNIVTGIRKWEVVCIGLLGTVA